MLSCLWSCPPRGNFKCVGVMALHKFPADGMRGWAVCLVGDSLGTFVFAAVSRIISLLILHCPWPMGNMWK